MFPPPVFLRFFPQKNPPQYEADFSVFCLPKTAKLPAMRRDNRGLSIPREKTNPFFYKLTYLAVFNLKQIANIRFYLPIGIKKKRNTIRRSILNLIFNTFSRESFLGLSLILSPSTIKASDAFYLSTIKSKPSSVSLRPEGLASKATLT